MVNRAGYKRTLDIYTVDEKWQRVVYNARANVIRNCS